MNPIEIEEIKSEWLQFVGQLKKHANVASILNEDNGLVAIGTALQLPGQPLGAFWPLGAHFLGTIEEGKPIRLVIEGMDDVHLNRIEPCLCCLSRDSHYHFESQIPRPNYNR